jgi:hypothetical protein
VELLGHGLPFLIGANNKAALDEETTLAQAVDEAPESETISDNGKHRQAEIYQEPAARNRLFCPTMHETQDDHRHDANGAGIDNAGIFSGPAKQVARGVETVGCKNQETGGHKQG